MQSILDERASPLQRAALTSVLQGKGADPGTVMLQIYRAMCSSVKPPLSHKIELCIDVESRKAKLRIGELVQSDVEPIRNPVTGMEHRARIELPLGKEFNFAETASGTTHAKGAVPLEFANSRTPPTESVVLAITGQHGAKRLYGNSRCCCGRGAAY